MLSGGGKSEEHSDIIIPARYNIIMGHTNQLIKDACGSVYSTKINVLLQLW